MREQTPTAVDLKEYLTTKERFLPLSSEEGIERRPWPSIGDNHPSRLLNCVGFCWNMEVSQEEWTEARTTYGAAEAREAGPSYWEAAKGKIDNGNCEIPSWINRFLHFFLLWIHCITCLMLWRSWDWSTIFFCSGSEAYKDIGDISPTQWLDRLPQLQNSHKEPFCDPEPSSPNRLTHTLLSREIYMGWSWICILRKSAISSFWTENISAWRVSGICIECHSTEPISESRESLVSRENHKGLQKSLRPWMDENGQSFRCQKGMENRSSQPELWPVDRSCFQTPARAPVPTPNLQQLPSAFAGYPQVLTPALFQKAFVPIR